MPKCKVCGKEGKSEDMVLVEPRKYTCIDCEEVYKEQGETKTDRQLLLDYINSFHQNPDWSVITAQIKQLETESDMKQKGMELALRYYLEIEDNPFNEIYGIKWIIVHNYEKAKQHYIEMKKLEEAFANSEEDEVVIVKMNTENSNKRKVKYNTN